MVLVEEVPCLFNVEELGILQQHQE